MKNDNRNKTVIREQETVVVNQNTGEITESKTTTLSKIEQEPDFIKLYIKDLSLMRGISTSGNEVIMTLLKCMTYENRVILNAEIRKEICEELNLKTNTLSHILSALCDADIMRRYKTNIYIMNPNLFGRGKWTDIKSLRVTYNYSSNGLKIETERNYEEYETLNGIDDDIADNVTAVAREIVNVLSGKKRKKALQFLD